MEKLNKLFALAQRADACGNVIDCVNPHDVIDIAESFLDMKKRAEAAEAALNTVRAQRDLEVTRNDRAEEEKEKLHAEIYRLQEEVRGPDGFDTWKDAAIALKLAAKNTSKDIDYLTAMSAFHSDDWHKMDPITA